MRWFYPDAADRPSPVTDACVFHSQSPVCDMEEGRHSIFTSALERLHWDPGAQATAQSNPRLHTDQVCAMC
jgi:hypothetical protein